ncbi:hypothetical protein M231_02765 [Tremella mesenterica]|uniref:Uncharacterized protein n=1 Tax=Tremella mesenterica TaxID=5217 RepID=A0A4Q1BQ40_TREME|nr:hypothetical protein M231_02765 [Tremella mesenterica]
MARIQTNHLSPPHIDSEMFDLEFISFPLDPTSPASSGQNKPQHVQDNHHTLHPSSSSIELQSSSMTSQSSMTNTEPSSSVSNKRTNEPRLQRKSLDTTEAEMNSNIIDGKNQLIDKMQVDQNHIDHTGKTFEGLLNTSLLEGFDSDMLKQLEQIHMQSPLMFDPSGNQYPHMFNNTILDPGGIGGDGGNGQNWRGVGGLVTPGM